MTASEMPLWDVIDAIRASDARYSREAYLFVVASLGATVQGLPAERLNDPERRHLSGQELMRGTIRLARQEFGSMAATVFREWGVHRGEDVGNIVFHLVRSGQLSARPEDSLDDFRGGPDLIEALARAEGPRTGGPGPTGSRAKRPTRPERGA